MRPTTTRLVVLLALLGASACAAIQQSEAIDAERWLAAAGFQMRLADTPQRLEKASSLPQRKLVPMRGEDGSLRFVYADATFCKCIYAGTQAAYDRYQRLRITQEISQENQSAASDALTVSDQMAANDWDWGVWGPWAPWW